MKRLTWAALVVLLLALVAAQCSAIQPGEKISESPPAENIEATTAESSGAEAPQKEAGAVNDPASSEPKSEIETETVEQDGNHGSACADPFADVEHVRFSPDVWSAESISRFVRPGLVDPDSGLKTNFCKHSIDYNEILSGGPPPDGIPPIDNPNFDSIAKGDTWLADVQPVISLVLGNQAKAYPLAILTRHEIANDVIADVPVAVTFCPLCNAAVVFNREVDGEVLRFGVSGNLRNSDLVMWDNKTLSWWQQFTGQAIVGDATGTQLEILPAQLVAWKDFKDAYPDGVVLSGEGRNYGSNPYTGYDSTTQPFLFLGTPDDRLRATERVLGYHKGEVAKAYPLAEIRRAKVIEDNLGGQDVVIFYKPGQVSALDNAVIEHSKEVGSAGMFIPEVDGGKMTFAHKGNKIIDNETGSTWDVFGRAVSGELEGATLDPVLSHMHFWFAWAAFKPETELFGG